MISTPENLRAAIAALIGAHHGSVSEAARRYGIRMPNLSDMLAGRRPVPAGLWAEIERDWRAVEIAPPPSTLRPEDDRDEPCGEALDPHLAQMAERAAGAGWTEPEIVTAVLGWVVHRSIEGAGPEATRDLLDQAIELIDIQP